jgi:hypothetical protein
MALYRVIEKRGLLCQRLFPVILAAVLDLSFCRGALEKWLPYMRHIFMWMSQFCDIRYVRLKTLFVLLEIVIHADEVNLCRFVSYVLLRLHMTNTYTSGRLLPHYLNAHFRLYRFAIEIAVIIFYLNCESHYGWSEFTTHLATARDISICHDTQCERLCFIEPVALLSCLGYDAYERV